MVVGGVALLATWLPSIVAVPEHMLKNEYLATQLINIITVLTLKCPSPLRFGMCRRYLVYRMVLLHSTWRSSEVPAKLPLHVQVADV